MNATRPTLSLSRLLRSCAAGWILLGATEALAAAPAQLTNTAGSCANVAPVLSAGGTIAAWQSTCNPASTNPDGSSEIFRTTIGQAPVQLTAGAACTSGRPSISSNGNQIAFESNCNLTGQNVDGNVEIFLWKSAGSTILQLTVSIGCDNFAPSISGNGDYVAFDSTCNLDGVNNDGRGSEIFRKATAFPFALEQWTNDPNGGDCDSTSASINNNGSVIAFDSDCDLDGSNEDRAIEIWTASKPHNSSQVVLARRTVAPEDSCSSMRPSIDGAGTTIAFTSDCNLDGGNADRSDEIFTVTSSNVIDQVTSATDCASGEPRMASSGTAVSFTSYCRFSVGQSFVNADMSIEAFHAGIGSSQGGILALSDGGGGCSSVAGGLSADGRSVLLDSDCNLATNNADGNVEIYSQNTCVCGGPVTRGTPPKASDALYVLRSAVGSSSCALCECDINGNGSIAASDALQALKAAVGQNVSLLCPAP